MKKQKQTKLTPRKNEKWCETKTAVHLWLFLTEVKCLSCTTLEG